MSCFAARSACSIEGWPMLLDRLPTRLRSFFRREALLINPAFRDLLTAHGLTSTDAFLNLNGPIISGHPDRHVMRTTIGEWRCILKREHHVPRRDRIRSFFDGHGLMSV